jgi:hypothetical protein
MGSGRGTYDLTREFVEPRTSGLRAVDGVRDR